MTAAIAGWGATEFSKLAGRSELQLAAEAIRAALTDAGLRPADVDGLVSYTIDPVEEAELVRTVGFSEINYSSRVPYGGGGSMGTLQHSESAIATGAADVVVIHRACRARSSERFGRAEVRMTATSGHSGTTAMQWCAPFGVLTPASWMSLNAARYMSTYGATSEDFGRAVVQLRDYASTNPAAWGFGRPITLDEHQASRWVAEPAIRLFDCCQETDGAVALVVTSLERARNLPQPPVVIQGTASAGLFAQEIASDHYLTDLAELAGAAALGRRVFAKADLIPDEIDAAMIYDAFTPILMMQLEAYGFCKPGEAKDFVADGALGPKGRLPTNPNGGLIGEGYIHGLNLVSEAVRQVRGEAANQLDRVGRVLVSSGRTAAVLAGD